MARPGAVMNSTSAELVSIQALWPASAAASALVFTDSSVTGSGVSGAGSAASSSGVSATGASASGATWAQALGVQSVPTTAMVINTHLVHFHSTDSPIITFSQPKDDRLGTNGHRAEPNRPRLRSKCKTFAEQNVKLGENDKLS